MVDGGGPPASEGAGQPPGAGGPLTLQEAAHHLGVHYMTAYRYVRLGLLQAEKSGGVWRVTPEALEALEHDRAAGRDAMATAPAAVGPQDNGQSDRRGAGRRRAPWAARLEHRLVAGDSRGAWGVIEAALASGTELDEVYLDIVAPAMASIGRRWERGELDVAVEHRASVITSHLLGRLGPRFARRGRSRGTVVLGAPAGERHALPLALLADLVRGAGWEVSDLGADVPASSFAIAAAVVEHLAVVGISITTPECVASGEAAIAAVRAAVPEVPILVGGHAIEGEAHALALGADGWAPDGRAVTALLDELAGGPPARRPTDARVAHLTPEEGGSPL